MKLGTEKELMTRLLEQLLTTILLIVGRFIYEIWPKFLKFLI